MSTRSMIGKMNKDGTIDAIYCHFDGYIEGVGSMLFEAYKDEEKIDTLIKGGDISSLGPSIASTSFYYDNPFSTFEDDTAYLDYCFADNSWVEYVYLWDGEEWLVCCKYDLPAPNFKVLEKELKKSC